MHSPSDWEWTTAGVEGVIAVKDQGCCGYCGTVEGDRRSGKNTTAVTERRLPRLRGMNRNQWNLISNQARVDGHRLRELRDHAIIARLGGLGIPGPQPETKLWSKICDSIESRL